MSVIVCFGAGDGKLTNLFFNPLLNGELWVSDLNCAHGANKTTPNLQGS